MTIFPYAVKYILVACKIFLIAAKFFHLKRKSLGLSLAVKPLSFHCGEQGFNRWSVNEDLACYVTWLKK